MGPYNPTMPYQQYPQYPYQPQQAYQPMPQTVVSNQSRAFSPIAGRVVNSLDEITVQEVPTDGTVALFPSADGACVYSKRWTPDGNISTMRFVPEVQEAQPQQPSPFDIINDRISELFDVVERIEERLPYEVETKRPAATRRKAVKADAAE